GQERCPANVPQEQLDRVDRPVNAGGYLDLAEGILARLMDFHWCPSRGRSAWCRQGGHGRARRVRARCVWAGRRAQSTRRRPWVVTTSNSIWSPVPPTPSATTRFLSMNVAT